MGLLFASPPLDVLVRQLTTAKSQKDVGRTLSEIKKLIRHHPELESHVPDELKKPPRLVVNNDQKQLREQPRSTQ